MTLTEIRLLLEAIGTKPRKHLGQNFMFDQNLVQSIVEASEIPADREVIEIGPGLGALTDALVQKTSRLSLLEQDTTFIPHLQSRFPRATVIQGDAMDTIEQFRYKISNDWVMGNLPYSIASPLMIRLCEADLRPKRMVFTIQWEVAERLISRPDTKDFGLLTLLIQPFYQVRMIRKVPPSVFFPRPKVDSAVVSLDRLENIPFETPTQESSFRSAVKKAFQQRRKSLGSIFGPSLPPFIPRNLRPENLKVDDWIQLTKHLVQTSEEEFDVVNEKDEIIGRETRKKVHESNLLHRAVHIFIRDSQGRLLLQKRSPTKDVSPNTWDSSAAGHLSAGESYDEAARRETVEELGIEVPLQQIQSFAACPDLGWEFVRLYQAISEGPFKPCPEEISEVKWWTSREIDKSLRDQPHDFARSFQFIWKNQRIQK